MNKIKVILFLGLVLLISGCNLNFGNSLTPIRELTDFERIEEASNNLETLDSYQVDMFMGMSLEFNKTAMDLVSETTGIYDQKNGTSKMEGTVTQSGQTSRITSYTEIVDGKVIAYNGVENIKPEWTKQVVSEDIQHDNNEFGKILSSYISMEKYKDSTEEEIHYKMIYNQESSKKLLKIFLQSFGGDDEENYAVSEDTKVDIYINKENYITKFKFDFSNIATLKINNTDAKLTKMVVRQGYSNFNKEEVIVIPQAVKDKAILQK